MTFKWPLIFASILCLFVGVWDLLNELPDSAKVFNSSNVVEIENLQASIFTPPRGTPRIRLVESTGKRYVIDCLTYMRLCDSGKKGSDVLSKGILLKLSGEFYWPIEASYASGRIFDKDESMLLYEIFRQRDSTFYRIWIALSAALFAFSVWFGRRRMFV